MALNRSFIGLRHQSEEPYEMCREKIRDYAEATGDRHPVYLSRDQAQAMGYPDVIAPPSFLVSLFFRLGGWPLYDPAFGKKKEPVCVHRAQHMCHLRPVHPGEWLVLATTVRDIYDVGPHEEFVLAHEVSTTQCEVVCRWEDRIVSRGTAIARTGES